jgi:ADP-ribose pyrophosphatase YjhB (NUDIX family)
MPKNFAQNELQEHIKQAQRDPYAGYPERRLIIPTGELAIRNNVLYLPDHTSEVNHHSNRDGADPALLHPIVPTRELPKLDITYVERWKRLGLGMDQYNRPLHPKWRELITNPQIGVFTGPGFYYLYGPNGTSDAAVYRTPYAGAPVEDYEWLLIKRRKEGATEEGKWALPGGFGEPDDSSVVVTARRELGEETGLTDMGDSAQIIQQRRPAGRRTTLNSWTENSLVRFDGDQNYLHDVAPFISEDARQEVEDVGWFAPSQIARLAMYTYHAGYVELAINSLAEAAA